MFESQQGVLVGLWPGMWACAGLAWLSRSQILYRDKVSKLMYCGDELRQIWRSRNAGLFIRQSPQHYSVQSPVIQWWFRGQWLVIGRLGLQSRHHLSITWPVAIGLVSKWIDQSVLNFKLEEKKDGCFGYPISYVLDTLEGYVRKSKLIYDKVTEVTGNPVDLPEASQKVVMSKLSYIRL